MLTKNQQRALSLTTFLAAGLYLFFIFSADTDKILHAMARITFSDWIIILACSFLNYLLRFLRWQAYITSFGHHISRPLHLSYYLAGLALTTTPAKAGETLRSLYLLRHDVKLSESLASFFTERLLDVVVMVLLSALIFLTFPEFEKNHAIFILSVIILLIVLLPLLATQYPQNILLFISHKFPNKKIQKIITHLCSLLKSSQSLLGFKRLYPGLLIGLVAWSIQGLGFYFILLKIGFPLALMTALTIYAISILAGAASFIPGGIGATETVMGLMLLSLGSEPHLAIAIPVLTRLATLWFAVCIGLLANAWLSVNNINSENTIAR
jgi:uncharacterized protein (TIRG00374 family)